MKIVNQIFLFFIWIRQKTLSSHTGIFKDFLYKEPVCTHHPHCSEYGKECFQKYDFLNALKYTMERIDNCTPSDKINYDPSSYKVVYFSSAPIWVPFLEELVNDKRFDVVGVVTMPDAPSGRWQKLKENVIGGEIRRDSEEVGRKIYEDELNKIEELEIEWRRIKLFKPKKIKNNKIFVEELKKLEPDFFVVLSYWKILPKEVLDIPKFWPINIHGSILPKYRWASPIQSVFLNWEKETWITIMYMDEKMDTWDIIKILKFPLTKEDNSKTVIDRFIELWPKFFVDTLWDFWKWKLKRIKQNDEEATYCGKFTKEDGLIDFENETAEEIFRKFQAFYLWPGIYTYWNWKLLKFTDIEINDKQVNSEKWIMNNKKVWDRFLDNEKLKIRTKKGDIWVKKLKLEWKKEMTAEEFLNGHKEFINS